jgi:2-polyprenyl-3-methyl-5-hydroxy-6-metoxy-1,4-benzoquinol methylase
MTSSALNARAERIQELGYDYGAQEKEFVPACNLCGADQWTVLTHRDRYGFAAATTACGVCGLTVLNPRMSFRAYGEFYGRVYRPLVSAYHGRVIDAATVQEEQRHYSAEMETLLAPFFADKKGASFLDVGGSTGVVAAHFRRRFGLKGTVLDPAPDEIAEAEALEIETITALVEEWEPAGRRFDVIGMFQTIDHLLDVSTTLRKLREIITPDGLFVVDIVDFRAAYLKRWSVEEAVKIDHPYSLTEETAEAYLARAGFRPVRKAYSADHHLVAYVCRPCEPVATVLPARDSVERFFRELRYVQNAPRPAGNP